MPTNLEIAFADRPAVLAAWVELNSAIKAHMDLRRYELATLAAARRLRSSYCCLAHGSVLHRLLHEGSRRCIHEFARCMGGAQQAFHFRDHAGIFA